MFVFVNMLSCLFLAALKSSAGKGLASLLSCMGYFLVFLSLFHMVFLVRCGVWLYQFLIFAIFLLLIVEANDCGAKGQEHIHIAGVNMKVVIPYSN